MSKSKTRFDLPRRFTTTDRAQTLKGDLEGHWVRCSDYNLLNVAYKGALYQLDEAGKHVHAVLNKLLKERTAHDKELQDRYTMVANIMKSKEIV